MEEFEKDKTEWYRQQMAAAEDRQGRDQEKTESDERNEFFVMIRILAFGAVLQQLTDTVFRHYRLD